MDVDALNIQITYGSAIKNSMPHFHMHLIPMFEYPEGKITHHIELTVEEMDEIAEKIRKFV